jgi:hypothetical protein
MTQSPTSITMRLGGNTAVFQSPLTKSVQTLDRGGFKWEYILNFSNVSKDKRRELMGIIASLRAQANRLRVPVHDNPRGGGYGGTPLVLGGSQTGSSLNVDGVTNKTNWIRAGDYFSVNVNGEHELKMCTADANSSGGQVTIAFEPRLRASPLNNAVIYVEDGALPKPTGVFHLRGPILGWSSRPFQGTSELSSITMDLVEDLFISQ